MQIHRHITLRRIAATALLFLQGGSVAAYQHELWLRGWNYTGGPNDDGPHRLILASLGVVAGAGLVLLSGRVGRLGAWAAFVGSLYQFAAITLVAPWFWERCSAWSAWAIVAASVLAIAAMLQDAVVRRGRPGLCSNCDYDLAGLDGARCPECGTVRDAGASSGVWT
ncbi:MAG: hypothetical protein R3B68_06530 [Phycisphaerales bacterium]